ncbi:MAG: hypothetical protein JTT11_00275 [Candidatus Brockarchaeota archaeon]|nr:hypothetical protein [Candidatus Brockarchaeota archaeon]
MAEVKKMAEALKAGATMLAEPCPNCSSPLFRFKSGEVRCVSCEAVAKAAGEGELDELGSALQSLERKATRLLSEASKRLEASGSDVDATLALAERCLSILEKVRSIRRVPSKGAQ